MQFLTLISLAVLSGVVAALPATDVNALNPRACASEVVSSNLARREGRGSKRSLESDLSTLTCIAAPELPIVNYVPPPLRQNLVEGQTGVALTLDVAVIDVTTCQPMGDVMVEVWSPNAFGDYGSTFLRGAFTSASNGVAEFQTIFPGFTSGGANHINLMIHTSSSISGSVSHAGQVFFTDRWTDVVSMSAPYNQNNNTRILNAQDTNFAVASGGGYNAIVDIESIHDDWPEGVIGYITVGINPEKKIVVPV